MVSFELSIEFSIELSIEFSVESSIESFVESSVEFVADNELAWNNRCCIMSFESLSIISMYCIGIENEGIKYQGRTGLLF